MLAQRRTMRPRFKFPIGEEKLSRYLQAAIMEEVEYRHRTFELSDSLQERIRKMAQWLDNDNTKNGMMLCGTCGNGKTTFIKAVQKERRLEIALQGERLFELKRIKQSVRGEAWDSHKVMFQIPDVEQNGNPDVNMN